MPLKNANLINKAMNLLLHIWHHLIRHVFFPNYINWLDVLSVAFGECVSFFFQSTIFSQKQSRSNEIQTACKDCNNKKVLLMEDPVFGVEPPTGQPVSGRFSQDKMKRFISLCRKNMFQSLLLNFRFLFWTLDVTVYIFCLYLNLIRLNVNFWTGELLLTYIYI